MKLKDNTYNTLKWIAQYALPGVGTLYFALSGIWGLPYGEQIVGTITAIDTFLGVLLGISATSYSKSYDGQMFIHSDKNDGEGAYIGQLSLNSELKNLREKNTITLQPVIVEEDKEV